MPYIPIAIAANKLGISSESMLYYARELGFTDFIEAKGVIDNRPSMLMKRSDVLALKRKWGRGVTVREAAKFIGTSHKVIRQFIRKKRLRVVRELARNGNHVGFIHWESLNYLMNHLRLKTGQPLLDDIIPITSALQMLSAYKVNMIGVIGYILSEQLRAYWAKEAVQLDEIIVSHEDVNLILNNLSIDRPVLTAEEVGFRMGVKAGTVITWAIIGLLTPVKREQGAMWFSREELKRFEYNCISTEEAACILQVTEVTVQIWARNDHLHPVSGPGVDDRPNYLFRRDEIERLRPQGMASMN